MLRVLLVASLALGGIRAEEYSGFEPEEFYARPVSRNDIIGIKRTGPKEYLEIKQDITEALGIRISVEYRDPTNHDEVLKYDDFGDLCEILDELVANGNLTKPPRPDELLGLKGKKCPLEKGLIELPWYSLPDTLDLDSEPACGQDISFVAYIESEESSFRDQHPYVEVRATSKRVC